MKNNVKNKPNSDSGIIWVLILGSSLTTLYFNSKIQDPFNSPKLWILILIAMWCLGHIFSNFKTMLIGEKYRASLILGILFITSQVVSLVANGSIYIGLFGENMRRNGILGYLSLVVIFITIQIYFNWRFTLRLDNSALTVGLILSIYGLMQISGVDFVSWNNPYNAVISTVGNPNFAAAIMAIIATLNFGSMLNNTKNIYIRLLHFIVVVLLFVTIVLSEARQGLISIILGFGIIAIVYLYSKNKSIGAITMILATSVGVFSVLGMLQIGPLSELLYKSSVTVRGYYWDAGIRMFIQNPLYGVGPDRYGAFFKEFRDSGYPLNYGWDITSTNAHNVAIQIFSTSGLLAGTTYVLIVLYVVLRAIIGLRKFAGSRRIQFMTYFAAWVAFQAQSLISIDNLGISIWGWLLSGVIIALSFTEQSVIPRVNSNSNDSQNSLTLLQPLISSFATIGALILVSILYQGESAMLRARISANPQDVNSKNIALENTSKVLNQSLIDPAYVWNSANILRSYQINDRAKEIFLELLKDDHRNLDALNSLAEISENAMNVQEGIKYRELIFKIDPWNSKNLLQLGRDYKFIGDQEKMIDVKMRILRFDNVSNESKNAVVELVS
jgi:O-antigen ligase